MVDKYTVGKLRNSSGKSMSLSAKKIWEGIQDTDFPRIIDNDDTGEFTHNAVDDENETTGSIAALKYKLTDEITWIVAWSNPIGADSKVYTAIVNQPIKWDQVKLDLDARGKQKYSTNNKFGYNSQIEVDPKVRSPILRAYIEEA